MATEEELERRAQELAARPYSFTLVHGEDDVWTSGVLEMPGVISEGDDPGEATEMAQDALVGTIMSLIELGQDVPEPFRTREFSGRLQLRLNPELHRRATMLATEQGVSLNRWLSQAVARGAGFGPIAPAIRREPVLRRVGEEGGSFSTSPSDARHDEESATTE